MPAFAHEEAPPMYDEAGTSFDDSYQICQRLGDGMTAVVYMALQKATGQVVVCKLAEKAGKREAKWDRLSQLMHHESRLLQQMDVHPNLVEHRGFFVGEGRLALMLDLVRGGDCQQLLQRRGALSEPVVQSVMSQCHGALSHLHAHGVLHRDVKLENLLCDTSVHPPLCKLCDLGHATTPNFIEKDRHFFGTPGYAAPEVTSGPLWTPAADAWSMGVVMYALLCNALPFEADDAWRRPADLSSRHWWKVSLEAKLLLQSLLEPNTAERATLEAFGRSAWLRVTFNGDGTAVPDTKAKSGMSRAAYSMANMQSLSQPQGLPHASSDLNIQQMNLDGGTAAAAASGSSAARGGKAKAPPPGPGIRVSPTPATNAGSLGAEWFGGFGGGSGSGS